MKVYIGPHKNWFGPYQLARAICFWHKVDHLREDMTYVDNFGDWLSKRKWLMRLLEWNYRGGHNRKIKVKIHDYDTWNMDDTLSHIIYPMLIQLKKTKHGSPKVDNEDVPAHLHRPDGLKEWDVDDNWHHRWNWVLDEMIWAFETSIKQDETFITEDGELDTVRYERFEQRRANGFRLFGKYYSGLWD